MEIISPMYDFMFKRLFSIPDNSAMLCDFLDRCIGFDGEKVKEVSLANTEIKKMFRDEDNTLDLYVKLENSKKDISNVEIAVQTCSFKNFQNPVARMMAMYSSQEVVNEQYDKLHKCIVLCVLDFSLYDDEECFHSMMLKDSKGNALTDKLQLRFLEIPKAQGLELTDNLDKKLLWAKVLAARSEEELDLLQEKADDSAISQAVFTIKKLSGSDEMRLEVSNCEKARNKAEELARFEETLKKMRMNEKLIEFALKEAAANSE